MALDRLAALLTDGETTALDMPWHLLDTQRVQALRGDLETRYAPSTTNRMLAALRGVLKEAWQRGLMDADTYHSAAGVENVSSVTPPRGRVLEHEEIQALFAACALDATPAGVRDVALLTVLFAGGLRRSEVVALDVRDYDVSGSILTIRSSQDNRERTVHATASAARAFEQWIMVRGTDPGPLFVPVNRGQKILLRERRMTDQAVYNALVKRGKQAKVLAFSPQDLRRTFIARLLDTGADLTTVQRLAGHSSVTTTQRYDRHGEVSRGVAGRMFEVPDQKAG